MTIEEIIMESHSYKECMEKLNWNVTSSNYPKLRIIVKNNSYDVSHFLRSGGVHNRRRWKTEEILVTGSTYGRGHLKRRLIKENLLEYKCYLCGSDDNWFGKKFSLILDHINGINNDNRLENLRLLCPNCNATLDTHCGKNMKRSKFDRINKCKCGNLIGLESEVCVKCSKIKQRKVERPPYDQLLKEIEETNYSAVGRKYGVSDNAIRKWLKSYS